MIKFSMRKTFSNLVPRRMYMFSANEMQASEQIGRLLEFENSVLSSGMAIADYDEDATTQRGLRTVKGANFSIVYPTPI